MPSTIPLDDAKVAAELTQYLPDLWKAIIDTDIDGAGSTSERVDRGSALYGKRFTARRLARTVFMGATPSVMSGHKGVEKKRIFLGTALPGDVPGNFHSALDQLASGSTYLYSEGPSYWYDTHPNISKTARDFADSLPIADVWAEVHERLAKNRRANTYFAGVVTAPTGPPDVADTEDTRLVIVGPEHKHLKGRDDSPAMEFARRLLTDRAGGMRQFQNSLVFLAADSRRTEDLEKATRNFLAWRHVLRQSAAMQLSGQQEQQAKTRMGEADSVVTSRLVEAYDFVIHPVQEPGAPFTLDAVEVRSGEDLLVRAGKKLHDSGDLSTQWNARAIHRDLTGVLGKAWAEQGHITLGVLWALHAQYPYLRRLRNRDVLVEGLDSVFQNTSWEFEGFAFADSYDGERYDGLVLPTDSAGAPAYVDGLLIVEPKRAIAQREAELADLMPNVDPVRPDTDQNRRGDSGSGGEIRRADAPKAAPTRYFGTVELDPVAYQRSFNDAAAEVLAHLARVPGVDLRVTVEIEATTPAGFDDVVRRIVSENGATLRFTNNSFEEE
ncbi:hypothetical protein [Tsukamurella soli]